MIIAIDGPAASGKGTLGKRLARHYGYRHLDTGVIYRAVAKALLDAGADLTNEMLAVSAALELDPEDVEASLETIARRFLDLVLSPEAVAVNRIIIGEVARFPALGNVFWQAGPERNRLQIEEFLRRAAKARSLAIDDPRLAAEQFASLVRGEVHLRCLFGLDGPRTDDALAEIVTSAVATFLRAFGRR